MPMLIVNDEEFNKELNKFIPPTDGKVVNIKRGRGDIKEVPNELRKIIGEEAITNGNTQKLANLFGLSKSSIDAYKHGATSCASYNSPDEELNSHNNEVRDRITASARSKLMLALQEITPSKLSDVKARDAASIAKDMSAVVKNLEPSVPQTLNNTQVVVYTPIMVNEASFDHIMVNE